MARSYHIVDDALYWIFLFPHFFRQLRAHTSRTLALPNSRFDTINVRTSRDIPKRKLRVLCFVFATPDTVINETHPYADLHADKLDIPRFRKRTSITDSQLLWKCKYLPAPDVVKFQLEFLLVRRNLVRVYTRRKPKANAIRRSTIKFTRNL